MTALPEQMQANILEAYNTPYKFTSVPLPTIQSNDQLLVKVDAAGYCHTDAVLQQGHRTAGPERLPHIGGHEFAGTVVSASASPSAAAKEYPLGSRVGVPGRGFGACGTCFECTQHSGEYVQAGYSFFCPQTQSNGLSKDGGFAEYAVVDARQCVPLADSLSAVDAAPLMCAGVTIFNAIKQCRLSPGQRLGILGCGGGLGHIGLQFAAAMGLRVLGVDAADAPLELARSLGTNADIVDARSTTPEQILERIGKEDGKAATDRAFTGLDAVIVLPESQKSFDFGMKLLRNHGLCMAVSIPVEGWHVSAVDLVFRCIKVHGSILGSHATLKETVAFAAKHRIKVVKKTFPLGKLNELVDMAHRGVGGKLVLDLSL